MSCHPRGRQTDGGSNDDRHDNSCWPVSPDEADMRAVLASSEVIQQMDGLFQLGGDDDYDDGQRSDLSCGDSTSVTPSVYEDEVVHGRRYHGYRRGRYPLPNDGQEQRREETNHALMLELAGGRLFYADIGEHPQKIIDIGTGTGSWAIDGTAPGLFLTMHPSSPGLRRRLTGPVADQYPSASVIGTDLSAIQPKWVPVNVQMFVDDCEQDEWLHGSGFDLVHFRGMAGVLRDLDGVLTKVYSRIRSGGWIEFQEVVPQILCDDGTMGADDALCVFYKAAVQGLRTFGFEPLQTATLEEIILRAGFTQTRCVTQRVPISSWPREKHLKTAGLLMKTVMLDSLGALAAKPLAALGISSEDRQALVARVKVELEDRNVHRYVNCCFCYGQKP